MNPIQVKLRAAADPEVAAKVRRAIPHARAIGVTVPRIRAIAAEARRETNFEDACRLMDQFCAGGCREEILAGVFLVGAFRKPVTTLPWTRIARWIKAIDNWEVCDQLAANVSAPRIHAEPALTAELRKLARDANLWRRRFALATAASLNQKGRLHPEITIELCRLLKDDREPMVKKGVGWALRELAKKDPNAVRNAGIEAR